MKFLLLNLQEEYVGTIRDITNARHREEINGEDSLDLLSTDSRIKKGFKVLYLNNLGHWKEFAVQGKEELHQDGDKDHSHFCESSFYETIGDYIESDGVDEGPLATATAKALAPTRWSVGIVDIPGNQTVDFTQLSAKESIHKVVEAWGGELRTRVDVSGSKVSSRKVDILARRGNDLGKRFVYTKDLLGVKRIVQRTDIQTALYGYGKTIDTEQDGVKEKLTFASINGGKSYVEDMDALALYGRLNPDGTRAHVFGQVSFNDIEDKQELLNATMEEFETRKVPQMTYECSVIDLKAYGHAHEGVDLGDTVLVIDKTFTPELRIEARVIAIDRDLLEPENTEIVLGSYRDDIIDSDLVNEEFINESRSKAAIWDRAGIIDQNGSINSEYLTDIIATLNNKLNAEGGYVYLSDTGEGITTYNKPIDQNPTKAIQLLGGAFRIANSKLPNGEFDWTTFGDGDGFVADSFIGGLLKGGKVNFDLTNGTLLIGNSITDYNLYFDGTTLKIRLGNGKTIEEEIVDQVAEAAAYTDSELSDLYNLINAELLSLQDQVDGSITTWFYDYPPTPSNLPAVEWDTVELRNVHLGDLFYDTITGYSYRYQVINNEYSWQSVKDTDVTKALEDASKAQDTADRKRTIFSEIPTTPYQKGDLWVRAGHPIFRATRGREVGYFIESDWIEAGNTTDAIQAAVDQTLLDAKSYTDSTISDFQDVIDTTFSDGIIAEAEAIAIEKYLNMIQTENIRMTKDYNRISDNNNLTGAAKDDLNTAYTELTTAYNNLNNAIEDAILDGSTTPTEKGLVDSEFVIYKAKMTLFETSINAAIEAIELKMKEDNDIVIDDIIENMGRIHTSDTPPLEPSQGILWLDTTDEPPYIKRWTGVEWEVTGIDPELLQTQLDTVGTELVEHNNQIEYIAGEITEKITKTEYYEFADETTSVIAQLESDFTRTAEEWDLKFKSNTGLNKLRNSVGFAPGNLPGVPIKHWDFEMGEISTEQSVELEEVGAGSGFVFETEDTTISQRVPTEVDTVYTLSLLYKMYTPTNDSTLKVYINSVIDELTDNIVQATQTETIFGNFKKIVVTFQTTSAITEIRLSQIAGDSIITNVMLAEGFEEKMWSPHPGEMYTTNFLSDAEGFKVRQIVDGHEVGYTQMSPTEFSGYYKGIKVFKMDKDIFQMSNAKIEKEIQIGGYRIIGGPNSVGIAPRST